MNEDCSHKRNMVLAAVWMAAVMLTACGRGQEPDREGADAVDRIDQPGQSIEDLEDGMKEAVVQENPSEAEAERAESDGKDQDDIRKRFGDHCIAEQTFEVELSEYPGKVWVVPFCPHRQERDWKSRSCRTEKSLRSWILIFRLMCLDRTLAVWMRCPFTT